VVALHLTSEQGDDATIGYSARWRSSTASCTGVTLTITDIKAVW
jgi:hypothetical protein